MDGTTAIKRRKKIEKKFRKWLTPIEARVRIGSSKTPKRACSGWHNAQNQEQRTQKNEQIMKKMKTTILTSVALAACVSTQLFAQNVKEDTITFALTGIQQVSVST